MTPERWRQIEQLYHSAVDRGVGVLANVDPDVRREVEALLAQKSRAETLDQPVPELVGDLTKTIISPGSQVGPYMIEGVLGQGGMGQVFLALDPRLGRHVAIKVSQHRFTDRFEREARAIAALNHPNVCTLYDVGPNYLVMELVEGETLAARLKHGKLPIEQAIEYGAQISGAVAAAHAKGIVHRDLKPGNIMLTKSGVKVLDFGLAKSAQDQTLTAAEGVVGTPAYMAPEQRGGRACDARADIYALGLVIYEMATGVRPTGDISQFDSLPEKICWLLGCCLAQDPEERWHSARDLKLELDWAARNSRAHLAADNRGLAGRSWLIPSAVAILAITALALIYFRQPAPDLSTISTIPPPDQTSLDASSLGSIASLSPDGTRIVFRAASEDGGSQLWIRPLDTSEAQPLQGTQNGNWPFWSPDGKSVGFFAGGELKTIEISGGPPVDVCGVSLGYGGSWAPDGTIIFVPNGASSVFRVPASGGQPVRVTSLNSKHQEGRQYSPQFLPDYRHFLYASDYASRESGIYLASLDGGEPKLLLRGTGNAVFAPPDHLLFLQNGALMVRHFDVSRYELSGDSVTVAKSLGTVSSRLSVSRNGILAFMAGPRAAASQLEWFNRTGQSEGTVGRLGTYYTPRLSPDGSRIAVALATGGPTRDIWTFDRAHGETRLTFDDLHNWTPVWDPSGTELAYSTNPREGVFHIYRRPADGSGGRRPVLEDDAAEYVDSWSSDGKYVAYERIDSKGKPGSEIWVKPLSGDEKPFPVVQTQSSTDQFTTEDPSISPDRKWLAYDSDESGQWEVYIVPFPHGEGRWQVPSSSGAQQPRWTRGGKELIVLGTGNRLMATEVVEKGAYVEIHAPQNLFTIHPPSNPFRVYDVTGDGQKFIVINQHTEQSAGAITIVTHWPALLENK